MTLPCPMTHGLRQARLPKTVAGSSLAESIGPDMIGITAGPHALRAEAPEEVALLGRLIGTKLRAIDVGAAIGEVVEHVLADVEVGRRSRTREGDAAEASIARRAARSNSDRATTADNLTAPWWCCRPLLRAAERAREVLLFSA